VSPFAKVINQLRKDPFGDRSAAALRPEGAATAAAAAAVIALAAAAAVTLVAAVAAVALAAAAPHLYCRGVPI